MSRTRLVFAVTLLIAVGTLGSMLAKAERPQLDSVASMQIDAFDLMSKSTNLPIQSVETY